jgi:hypothetical protein
MRARARVQTKRRIAIIQTMFALHDEQILSYRKLFHAMDADGGGSLDIDELRTALAYPTRARERAHTHTRERARAHAGTSFRTNRIRSCRTLSIGSTRTVNAQSTHVHTRTPTARTREHAHARTHTHIRTHTHTTTHPHARTRTGGGEVDEAEFVEAIIYAVMSNDGSEPATPRSSSAEPCDPAAAGDAAGLRNGPVQPAPDPAAASLREPSAKDAGPRARAHSATTAKPASSSFREPVGSVPSSGAATRESAAVPLPGAAAGAAGEPVKPGLGRAKSMGWMLLQAHQKGELSSAAAAAGGAGEPVGSAAVGPAECVPPAVSQGADADAVAVVAEDAASPTTSGSTSRRLGYDAKMAWGTADSPRTEAAPTSQAESSSSADRETRATPALPRELSPRSAAGRKAPSESRAARLVRAKLHRILKKFGRARHDAAVTPHEDSPAPSSSTGERADRRVA